MSSPGIRLLTVGLLAALAASGAAAQFGGSTELIVRVTDQHSSAPIERARIDVGRFPAGTSVVGHTDRLGRASFSLSVGSYIVRVQAMGYEPGEARVEIIRGDISRSVDVALARTPGATVAPAATVSVRELSIPESARAEFRKAQRELERKAAANSIPLFRKALEIYPDYYEALHGLGRAYVELKQTAAAEAAFRQSLELEPDYLPSAYALAVLLMAERRYTEAEPVLRAAMRRDPRNWEWPFELARCLLAQDRWGEALAYARLAPQLPNPPGKVHLLLADIYSGLDRDAEAIAALEAFLTAEPNSPQAARVRAAIADLRRRSP